MKYLLCLMLILPQTSRAQAGKVAGLGHYSPGLTTPDSLSAIHFREQDQPLVKGTLALRCTHVRTFTASQAILEGIPVTNLVLHFYDDRLFRIECDYDEPLRRIFTLRAGPGVSRPANRVWVCSQGNDKFLTVWGEDWPGEETAASVIYWKGYTAGCLLEEAARLVLWSQRLSALCSECDLQPTDSLVEEYRRWQRGR